MSQLKEASCQGPQCGCPGASTQKAKKPKKTEEEDEAEAEEVKDLTLKEAAVLLGAGLASGALISVRSLHPPPPLAPAP